MLALFISLIYFNEKEEWVNPRLPNKITVLTLLALREDKALSDISVCCRSRGDFNSTLATSIATFPFPTIATAFL